MGERVGVIKEKDMADFARLMRDYRAGRLFADPSRPTPVNQPGQRWIPCINNTADVIPAYGVVAVRNASLLGDTQIMLDVCEQSSTTTYDNNAGTLAVNSSVPIGRNGGGGLVTFDFPTWARLYTSDVANMVPGCVLHEVINFEVAHIPSITQSPSTRVQLLSDPVPISGGYVGLIKAVPDNAYGICNVDFPTALTSGATGYLDLYAGSTSGNLMNSGVDMDEGDEKIYIRKAGHYIVRLAMNLSLGWDSGIEFYYKIYNAAGTLVRTTTPCTIANALDQSNGYYANLQTNFALPIWIGTDHYLRVYYECTTSANYVCTCHSNSSTIEIQRMG